MIVNGVSLQENNCVKPAKKEKAKGSLRAYGASQVASLASLPAGLYSMCEMGKINKNLTPEQIKTINESVEKFVDANKLKEKGLSILDAQPNSSSVKLSTLKSNILSIINPQYATIQGKNAYFSPAINSVVYNKNKGATLAFHEVGHAINYNSSKFWKTMQCMRTPSQLIAAGFALFGAFSNKEVAKEGEELTKGQKAKNFVRDNVGVFATASMLPVVAEEVMASVRGCKWANSNLPKELAKKVAKTNIAGAVSYIAVSLALGFSAHVAVKVKDKINEKKEQA